MCASDPNPLVVAGLLATLAGCTPAATALQLRSARQLGCTPAHELKVSGQTPGDPHRNLPQRWNVTGCGVAYRCSSFLMASGAPAHTECAEVQRPTAAPPGLTAAQRLKISARLKQVGVQQVAAATGCGPEQVQVKGELVQGTAYIHMVQACGQSFRCLTLGAGSVRESPTQCEALATDL